MAARPETRENMSDVIRVFVEKKPGFDVEAQHILADLVENLGMKSVTDVKLLNRYDISGLSPAEFAQARGTIFSEPNVDNVYEETYEAPAGYRVFAMEYLPGHVPEKAGKVYLSLGKKEETSGPARMRRVGENTRQTAEILRLAGRFGEVPLRMENGGHFTDIPGRWQTAFCWLDEIQK